MPGGTEDALEDAEGCCGAWCSTRHLLLCLEIFRVPEPLRWGKPTLCQPDKSQHPGHTAWPQPPPVLSMAQALLGLQCCRFITWDKHGAGGMGSQDCDSSLAQALGTLGGAWSEEEISFTEVSPLPRPGKSSSMASCAVQVNLLVQHVNNYVISWGQIIQISLYHY